jgi:hypothetical protein
VRQRSWTFQRAENSSDEDSVLILYGMIG